MIASCSLANTPSGGTGCSSISSARRRRSSTRSVRFVLLPARQIKIPEAIPQPKARVISEAVVHAGRSKRFIDHIQAASIHCVVNEYLHKKTYSFRLTWKIEFPSLSKQIHRAELNKE